MSLTRLSPTVRVRLGYDILSYVATGILKLCTHRKLTGWTQATVAGWAQITARVTLSLMGTLLSPTLIDAHLCFNKLHCVMMGTSLLLLCSRTIVM